MSIIKAPYNFVPLSKQVVAPYWAPYISHDIPFKDEKSGTLEVKITAKSPIFVRDARKMKGEAHVFSQTSDGKYFIPGSSIRGMIRNVMEIMTFSKMERVNNHHYSFRDFENEDLYNPSNISKKVLAGWLSKTSDGKYKIIDCDRPGRINLKYVDQKLKTFFEKKIRNPRSQEPEQPPLTDEQKSAKFKYEEYTKNSKKGLIRSFREVDQLNGLKYFEINSEGNREGTLVFTGQPGYRDDKGNDGKVYEFIFFDPKNPTQAERNVDDPVIKNFFFAYFDQENSKKQSVDWKYWKPKLENGERIPVFFRYEKDRVNIKDMGLSFLYKIVYDYSVKDIINGTQPEKEVRDQAGELDMTEAIFGHVRKKVDEDLLKGRVHFGHAFASKAQEEKDSVTKILSSPKASYYPTYLRYPTSLQQKEGEKKLATYMDKDAEVSGWKRYPVQNQANTSNAKDKSDTVTTTFTPLKSASEFICKIRYHNLRKIELGALLSALTFHQTAGSFHSLGQAKPFGYGKIKLSVTSEDSNIEACLKAFEAFMTFSLGTPWAQSDQIKELITTVQDQESSSQILSYMILDPQKQINEFSDAKNNRDLFKRYSALVGDNNQVLNSLTDSDFIDGFKKWYEDDKTQYPKKISYGKQVAASLKGLEDELTEKLEAYKKDCLNALVKRKEEIKAQAIKDEQKEREQAAVDRKERLRQEALKNGPDYDQIKPKKDKRKPLAALRNVINKLHISRAYPDQNIESLIQENPQGILLPEFRPRLLELVVELAPLGNKNIRGNWAQSPFEENRYFAQIRIWIGDEEARELYKKVCDLLD